MSTSADPGLDPRLEALAQSTAGTEFHAALRLIDWVNAAHPRSGTAVHPQDEPVRLGQDPALHFQPQAISAFVPGSRDRPGHLRTTFLGLFGPRGPLPLHITEQAFYAWRAGQKGLSAFADLFHHRALLLLHRAWADAEPTAQHDRPQQSAFARQLASLCGFGTPATRERGPLPAQALLGAAAHWMSGIRNAAGLTAILSEYFELPVQIDEFVEEWLELPEGDRWRLSSLGSGQALGIGTVLGARTPSRTERFRVQLGPLGSHDFQTFLPGEARLERLVSLVNAYAGPALAWDLRLVLKREDTPPLRLRAGVRLGYDSCLPTSAPALAQHHTLEIKTNIALRVTRPVDQRVGA